MTWKTLTQEDELLCRQMRKWIRVVRRFGRPDSYGPNWLPTDADIRKSALFERIRSGKEPLDYPPPVGMACPWFALVEEPGPFAFACSQKNSQFADLRFLKSDEDIFGSRGMTGHPDPNNVSPPFDKMRPRDGSETKVDFQFCGLYCITKRISPTEYVIRDGGHDTPYRWTLRWDGDYRAPRGHIQIEGAWLVARNKAAEPELIDHPAIRLDGAIWRSPRLSGHWTATRDIDRARPGLKNGDYLTSEDLAKAGGVEGFVTTKDRFVDRSEARKIAERENQIKRPLEAGKELQSANIWESWD